MERLAALAERASGFEGLAAELGARELEAQRVIAEHAKAREAASRMPPATSPAPVAAEKLRIPGTAAQRRIVDELAVGLTRVGAVLRGRPPTLEWAIRSECRSIAMDARGRKAVRYACQLPARMRKILVRVVELAGGWTSRAGRRLVACAWSTWRLSRRVVGGRGRPWCGGRVVDGWARGVWCLLVVDADGHCPSLSTLWGTHTGRRVVPGPMTVLRRAGLWTRIQPPSDVARFVGPSGWALGQMWFGRSHCGGKALAPEEEQASGAELLALLALLEPDPPRATT